ncbi:MAG: PorV/PorQ family protein [bacterium]|nr:PorV/PorQ family protein [bacterium]
MKKILVFIVFLFSTTVLVFSTASQAGAIFLMIYPGSRAVGLGNAYTAISDDALASYYNPAGLGLQEKRDIVLMHVEWLPALSPDMYYEYAGAVVPTKYGVFGGSLIYLTTGETSATESNDETATWNTFDLAVTLSYAYKLKENLSVGASGKFIYSFLAPDWVVQDFDIGSGGQGRSVALDLGVIYNAGKTTTLGASLSNIGPGIQYIAEGSIDDLPCALRLGIKQMILENKLNKLLFTTDITKVFAGIELDSLNDSDFVFEISKLALKKNRLENDTIPPLSMLEAEFLDTWLSFGLEYLYYDLFALRTGYFLDYFGERMGFTFGGGVVVKNSIRIDLGVDQDIYNFDTTNYRISIGFRW